MFDIPSVDNVSEVIVDVSSVKGDTQPIIVHSKNKQDKDKSKPQLRNIALNKE